MVGSNHFTELNFSANVCVCILCHDFKEKYISYIGLQLPSTMASSSPILYGVQTTTTIPTETALPCCLYNIAITEE